MGRAVSLVSAHPGHPSVALDILLREVSRGTLYDGDFARINFNTASQSAYLNVRFFKNIWHLNIA